MGVYNNACASATQFAANGQYVLICYAQNNTEDVRFVLKWFAAG